MPACLQECSRGFSSYPIPTCLKSPLPLPTPPSLTAGSCSRTSHTQTFHSSPPSLTPLLLLLPLPWLRPHPRPFLTSRVHCQRLAAPNSPLRAEGITTDHLARAAWDSNTSGHIWTCGMSWGSQSSGRETHESRNYFRILRRERVRGGGCSFSLILAHGEERSTEACTESQGRTQGGKKRTVRASGPKLWLRAESREKGPHVSITGDLREDWGAAGAAWLLGRRGACRAHSRADTTRLQVWAAPARQPGSKNQERCLSTRRQHLSPRLRW